MKRMNVREFRTNFSRVTEPIEVLRGTQTIGVFYPGFLLADLGVKVGYSDIKADKIVPGKK